MLRAIAIVVLVGATPAVAEKHRSPTARPALIERPSPPLMPGCDPGEYQERAREDLAKGMYYAALSEYEKALRCNVSPALLADAAAAACMVFRLTKRAEMLDKARRYVDHLPPSKQTGIYLHCLTPLFDPLPE